MTLKQPQLELPRRGVVRGGADLWDTNAGAVLRDEYFVAASPGSGLSLSTATWGSSSLAIRPNLKLPVGVRSITAVAQAQATALRVALSTRAVNIADQALGVNLTARLDAATIGIVPLSVLMVEIPPPVVFALSEAVWIARGAPVTFGSVQQKQVLIVSEKLFFDRPVARWGNIAVLIDGSIIVLV